MVTHDFIFIHVFSSTAAFITSGYPSSYLVEASALLTLQISLRCSEAFFRAWSIINVPLDHLCNVYYLCII